jgi:hypothetical protein
MSSPVPSSAALPIAYAVLRVLVVVNWVMVRCILALCFVIAERALDHARFQTFSFASRRSGLIMGLRAIAALGLVGVP